jgi:hypothetical protein
VGSADTGSKSLPDHRWFSVARYMVLHIPIYKELTLPDDLLDSFRYVSVREKEATEVSVLQTKVFTATCLVVKHRVPKTQKQPTSQ